MATTAALSQLRAIQPTHNLALRAPLVIRCALCTLAPTRHENGVAHCDLKPGEQRHCASHLALVCETYGASAFAQRSLNAHAHFFFFFFWFLPLQITSCSSMRARRLRSSVSDMLCAAPPETAPAALQQPRSHSSVERLSRRFESSQQRATWGAGRSDAAAGARRHFPDASQQPAIAVSRG